MAETSRASSASAWGPKQRVLLVGILICAIGLGITGFFWSGRPVPPPHERRIEMFPQYIENMSLMQTLELWGALERGLPEELGREDQMYQVAKEAFLRRTGVALFIAGVGMLIMIVSVFIPSKRKRPRPRGAGAT